MSHILAGLMFYMIAVSIFHLIHSTAADNIFDLMENLRDITIGELIYLLLTFPWWICIFAVGTVGFSISLIANASIFKKKLFK